METITVNSSVDLTEIMFLVAVVVFGVAFLKTIVDRSFAFALITAGLMLMALGWLLLLA